MKTVVATAPPRNLRLLFSSLCVQYPRQMCAAQRGGRVIRQKADAGLRAIREASAGMHVIGGCQMENALLQFLRPSSKSLQPDSIEPARCKSIMEASQKRLQRYTQAPAALQMAIIQLFSDAYLLALSKGDQQWANAAEIAASFSADAVLKTQDRRTFYGKPAVLKRLNTGATAVKQKSDHGLGSSCTGNMCWCRRCWNADKVVE
ncbi:hypothetical protein ABBQ32_001290 [Trebouxia sp. C0010 RCD-2024]